MRYLFVFMCMLLSSQIIGQGSQFFDFSYEDKTGRVLLKVTHLDEEFLYINALAAGVGSNDLGLDRGKIGDTRIVKFVMRGNKLLLLEPNQKYRADSKNLNEVAAVSEAFASSVLWGFDIISMDDEMYVIDLTPFLLQDANDIIRLLKDRKEGNYKIDKSRSAVVSERLHSFPKNTEFESILTFVGNPEGKYLKTVVPSAEAVTVSQHQSFVALPDGGYLPRPYHPYSGFNNILYYDYATPIHDNTAKRYITRHRLEKKDPGAAMSEAVEPIIYYVDAGCPEPIKSALIEGASWWDQAFTEAGFINAFQVKELPEDVHPLDVRYNVIQWVHRSTRGWSYGASIVDPRTGEIIKGHVSLGSLRVKQDFMIAQGILSPYSEAEDHGPMTEIALARLRQLSAHEVGHTIGLAHNFAASSNDRASVMDYPHPLIHLEDGKINYDKAYDNKIGRWDQRAIAYGYTPVHPSQEAEQLRSILINTKKEGLLYMSDADARPTGSAHPKAHLWDNGPDPIEELKRLMELRSHSMENFGANTVIDGTPYSELEKVFVPLYLMHRYQVEAAAKAIGGVEYEYAVKGFDDPVNQPVPTVAQYAAVTSILSTLSHESLAIPSHVLDLLLPPAKGFDRTRESFTSNMNMVFDPLNTAEAYVNFVLRLMLHPDRLSRILLHDEISVQQYLNLISTHIFEASIPQEAYARQLHLIPQKLYVIHLIKLTKQKDINQQVSAHALYEIARISKQYFIHKNSSAELASHQHYLETMIRDMDTPEMAQLPTVAELPPGSPIGCDH